MGMPASGMQRGQRLVSLGKGVLHIAGKGDGTTWGGAWNAKLRPPQFLRSQATRRSVMSAVLHNGGCRWGRHKAQQRRKSYDRSLPIAEVQPAEAGFQMCCSGTVL